MKKILLFLFILLLPSITYWNSNIKDIKLSIKWKSIDWIEIANSIDKLVNKKYSNLEKRKKYYEKIIKRISKTNWSNPKKEKVKEILLYLYNKSLNEIKEYYSKTQRISLWYTKKWKEIYAYYKWNPKNWYFWIFSNIHWWYEYWTYTTALYLKDQLDKSWKKWRFIIPSINPEWLEYYYKNKDNKKYYIKWRVNSNNVDLNRNFCTSNFILRNFIKNWEIIKTWINNCNSEEETKIIINTLNVYKFNKIISLHSRWNILFIPDNSIDDKNVIKFWKDISNILTTYKFDIDYKNQKEKKQKIFDYEIDEWWSLKYTWTMESYIYEKYKIPTILIELESHWEIEQKLKNIIKLL